MSDTPETDAFAIKFKSVCGSKAWVPTDICRRFERERDEAREESEYYKARYEQLNDRPEIPKWFNGREIPADIKEETK